MSQVKPKKSIKKSAAKKPAKTVKKPAAAAKSRAAAKKSAKKKSPGPTSTLSPNSVVLAGLNGLRTLRGLLTEACEHALDAADLIADETIVEADEDHGFRVRIAAIGAAAGISLRERAPKTEYEASGHIWISDKNEGNEVPLVQPAELDEGDVNDDDYTQAAQVLSAQPGNEPAVSAAVYEPDIVDDGALVQ